MHKITLGEKTYTIPEFKGHIFRTAGEVERIYEKMRDGGESATLTIEEKDALVDWFCGAFEHQFTPDDVWNDYPWDDLIKDIFALYIAMMNMATRALTDFPIPATTPKQPR